jgi:Fur family transcriptional regulator, ferric uptake regulator
METFVMKAVAKDKSREYEVFSQYLKKKNLKLTAQRDLILDTFLSHRGHISAEELFQKARAKQSHVGFATVYRTLKHLTQCGLARELDFGDGRTQYEPEFERQHHDHMICTKCGAYIEFLNPQIEELQEQVSRKHGFKITSHRMQLYGLCQKCQKAAK